VTRLVDLDDAAGLELAWQALERRRAVCRIDPELRHAIEVRCARLTPDFAEPILRELSELHPAVVLDAHFHELVPNRPTIGAVIRHRERPQSAGQS